MNKDNGNPSTRHATGKRLPISRDKDFICASCAAPWHMKHLARQQLCPPGAPAATTNWLCPRCTKTCCCQIECTGGPPGHRCCHLRRKQLKERRQRESSSRQFQSRAGAKVSRAKRQRLYPADDPARAQQVAQPLYRAVAGAAAPSHPSLVTAPLLRSLPPLRPSTSSLPSVAVDAGAGVCSPPLAPVMPVPGVVGSSLSNPSSTSPVLPRPLSPPRIRMPLDLPGATTTDAVLLGMGGAVDDAAVGPAAADAESPTSPPESPVVDLLGFEDERLLSPNPALIEAMLASPLTATGVMSSGVVPGSPHSAFDGLSPLPTAPGCEGLFLDSFALPDPSALCNSPPVVLAANMRRPASASVGTLSLSGASSATKDVDSAGVCATHVPTGKPLTLSPCSCGCWPLGTLLSSPLGMLPASARSKPASSLRDMVKGAGFATLSALLPLVSLQFRLDVDGDLVPLGDHQTIAGSGASPAHQTTVLVHLGTQ